MTVHEKRIVIALALSAMLILLNIVAVTQSTAVDYFSQIEQFIRSFLQTLQHFLEQ